jgi:hypothetical protein
MIALTEQRLEVVPAIGGQRVELERQQRRARVIVGHGSSIVRPTGPRAVDTRHQLRIAAAGVG